MLRYAQEVSAQKKLTRRHWIHDYYPVCILPVKFLMWMEFVVVIICNGHGPAAIWPGSFDKNSRILRILRNILLFYGISLASFLVSMGYTAS